MKYNYYYVQIKPHRFAEKKTHHAQYDCMPSCRVAEQLRYDHINLFEYSLWQSNDIFFFSTSMSGPEINDILEKLDNSDYVASHGEIDPDDKIKERMFIHKSAIWNRHGWYREAHKNMRID